MDLGITNTFCRISDKILSNMLIPLIAFFFLNNNKDLSDLNLIRFVPSEVNINKKINQPKIWGGKPKNDKLNFSFG